MEGFDVKLVDGSGVVKTMREATHALECLRPGGCQFPVCACGPKEMSGIQIKNPIEPRIRKKNIA